MTQITPLEQVTEVEKNINKFKEVIKDYRASIIRHEEQIAR